MYSAVFKLIKQFQVQQIWLPTGLRDANCYCPNVSVLVLFNDSGNTMNQPVYFPGMTEPLVVSMALISLSSMHARTNSSSSSSPSCHTVKMNFRFIMCFRFQISDVFQISDFSLCTWLRSRLLKRSAARVATACVLKPAVSYSVSRRSAISSSSIVPDLW